MKIFNDIACNLNWIQIQLKRNEMQIGAQGIENMLVTSIIHDYGMLKKKKPEKTSFHFLDLIQDQFGLKVSKLSKWPKNECNRLKILRTYCWFPWQQIYKSYFNLEGVLEAQTSFTIMVHGFMSLFIHG